jgi:hypothetical protein
LVFQAGSFASTAFDIENKPLAAINGDEWAMKIHWLPVRKFERIGIGKFLRHAK